MSGKNAATENFPVGSWLLPARLRPHVFIFYDFARAADDIADNPNLSAQEKIHHLDRFQRVLLGDDLDADEYAFALKMRDSLVVTGIGPQHCIDLLTAFRQDAVKNQYADWGDLIRYCRLSAAPVGRYLIDLHGGSAIGYGASDALCMALQIINHVQDFGDDYRLLGRVYLPVDWMAEAGVADGALAADACTPAIRQVLDWMLCGVDGLLADSAVMTETLTSSRLAFESAIIIAIAKRLRKKLARSNPLAEHVTLDKWELVMSAASGAAAGLSARL